MEAVQPIIVDPISPGGVNSPHGFPRRSSTLTHIGINELRKGRVQLFHVLEAGLGFLSDFRQIKRLAIL